MARKRNVNQTGRTPTDRFIRISMQLFHSPAYRSLSLNARALLIELESLYNGSNNGDIFLSIDDARDRLGLGDDATAIKAFNELTTAKFIVKTVDSSFAVKASHRPRARRWRLTWYPWRGVGGATHAYREYQPSPKSKPYKRMDKGLRAIARYKKKVVSDQRATAIEKSEHGSEFHTFGMQSEASASGAG